MMERQYNRVQTYTMYYYMLNQEFSGPKVFITLMVIFVKWFLTYNLHIYCIEAALVLWIKQQSKTKTMEPSHTLRDIEKCSSKTCALELMFITIYYNTYFPIQLAWTIKVEKIKSLNIILLPVCNLYHSWEQSDMASALIVTPS